MAQVVEAPAGPLCAGLGPLERLVAQSSPRESTAGARRRGAERAALVTTPHVSPSPKPPRSVPISLALRSSSRLSRGGIGRVCVVLRAGCLEPTSRLELETCGLRNRCSTTELSRQGGGEYARGGASQGRSARGHPGSSPRKRSLLFRGCHLGPTTWCYGWAGWRIDGRTSCWVQVFGGFCWDS
jgi:hypothetical protein